MNAGYTIPAGWVIMIALPVVHFDPDKYENPFEFNPWRWQVIFNSFPKYINVYSNIIDDQI